MTLFVFISLLGSTPVPTTLTIGVKPMRLLTFAAMSSLVFRHNTRALSVIRFFGILYIS